MTRMTGTHKRVPAHALQSARGTEVWTPRSAPMPNMMEDIACPLCGARDATAFATANDDLTGKPGDFTFVRCRTCRLTYQNPRIRLEHIGIYYDEDYIAHRRKTQWGWLTPFYRRAMDKLDYRKLALIKHYMDISPQCRILDVGCGAGSFLALARRHHGASVDGLDFKDLSDLPWMHDVCFHRGLFYEKSFSGHRFDLITMWHFLEHDYEPLRSLRHAAKLLDEGGLLIVEVPNLDSWTRAFFGDRWPGLQAPQHTVLFDYNSLEAMAYRAGLEIVAHLSYGAFPSYFYLFAGIAFQILKGRGLNLDKAILPYFAGQLLLAPVLIFERYLNLAMQTIICRKAVEQKGSAQ